MIKIPKNVVSTIENSCKMNNVRGASDWRSMNDGKGHKTNIMHNLVQARKAEWFVWKVLSENKNINNLVKPNFDRDERASEDMSFEDTAGKKWYVEVKSCEKRKRDRNGYQFQIRRKTRKGLSVVDPYIRSDGKKGGDLLFYCVMVDGNKCIADSIFGTPRSKLVCSDPNRIDLKGLKYAIHPREQVKDSNIIF